MTRRMARVLGGAVGAVLVCAGVSNAQTLQPCTTNCIQVAVGEPNPLKASYNVGDTFEVPLTITKATGAGVDSIAAIAMSLGIPGLELADCTDADTAVDGLVPAIVPQVPEGYRVVVENTSCKDRGRCSVTSSTMCTVNDDCPGGETCEGVRCLCPGSGQTRDSFVNIVVFGPKDLTPPITIPVLPDGDLVSISLTVGTSASSTVPLHLYVETDTSAKPDFTANLSVGDMDAKDQTGCRGNQFDTADCGTERDIGTSKVATTDQTLQVEPSTQILVCDVAPSTGDNAGDFGSGSINNSDIVAIFRASLLPSARPADGTARFSGMDSVTEDSPPTCGGNGSILNNDVVSCFRRSLLSSLPRYDRQGLGEGCTSSLHQ